MSVILIGGSSSVGKTTVAAELSRRLGVEHVCVDDLRREIDDPELRLLEHGPEVWDLGATELCLFLIRATEALAAHLRSWIEQVPEERSVVLEGEGIDPELIASTANAGAGCGVVVIESDAACLHNALFSRSESFRSLSEPRRRAVANMNSHYGLWLQARAEQLGTPWLNSRPWPSLADRIVDALSEQAGKPWNFSPGVVSVAR